MIIEKNYLKRVVCVDDNIENIERGPGQEEEYRAEAEQNVCSFPPVHLSDQLRGPTAIEHPL